MEPSSGGAGGEERDELFAAWLDALVALAGERTAAWFVEDVHWAGPDLLAFLSAAHAADAPRGRLVVATARPSLLEAAPEWTLPDEAAGRHVHHLPTLEPAAAGDLVRGLVGGALPDRLVARIAERSDGNPLFIEELLRTWVSVGTLVGDGDGGWRLAVDASEVPLPRSVQQIYAAQLDDLPPAARLTARRASVAGRRFPFNVLDRLGIADGAEAIEQLARRALVSGPRADPVEGEMFAYRHALLRDAGYASLARAERARLHVELARWLEGVAGPRRAEVAEAIGSHYAAALESAPGLAREVAPGLDRALCSAFAAEWLEQAAVAALEVAAHAAATMLARRSIELTGPNDLLGHARRTEILADAIAAASNLADALAEYERALGLFRQARVFAEDTADAASARAGMARTARAMGELLSDRIHFADARDLANRVLTEIGEAEDGPSAQLLLLRGWAAAAAGIRDDQPLADVNRALAIAMKVGDPELELLARSNMAGVKSEVGGGRVEDHTALREAAERIGDWRRALSATISEAMWFVDDRVDAAWERIASAARLADAHGLPESLAWTDYLGTEVGLRSGDWDVAVASGRRAIDAGERNGYLRVCVRTWFPLSVIAAERSDRELLERAARWFKEHEADFPGSPYGLLMHAGVDLRLAAHGLRPVFVPDPEVLEASFREDFAGPAWYDAVAEVLGAWVEAGREADAKQAVGVIRAGATEASALGLAYMELSSAIADRSPEQARAARSAFDALAAPWYSLRALRVLELTGAATRDERAAAAAIEGRLGIGRAGARTG